MMCLLLKTLQFQLASSLEIMSGNKIVVQNDGSNADVIRVSCKRFFFRRFVTVLEDV